MEKIYFFETENGDVIDAEARGAWSYWNNMKTTGMKYLGWSDGRFMKEYHKRVKPRYDERGLMKPIVKKMRDNIKKAAQQEIDFARNNEDKTPPPDFSVRFKKDRDVIGEYVFNPNAVR
jgi:hypothetical protein